VLKYLKGLFIAFLIGVAAVSASRYILIMKEKRILLDNFEKEKMHVINLKDENRNLLQTLEKEKILNQALFQKNGLLKDNLRASNKRINRLFEEFTRNDQNLNFQISSLKAENIALRDEENKLKLDLAQVSQQRDELNSRLSSIPELKKAIKELKKQKKIAQVVHIDLKEKTVVEATSEGNRGFLVKDGKPFSALTVKIEVNPALKSEQ